jgi:hypothetical protein
MVTGVIIASATNRTNEFEIIAAAINGANAINVADIIGLRQSAIQWPYEHVFCLTEIWERVYVPTLHSLEAPIDIIPGLELNCSIFLTTRLSMFGPIEPKRHRPGQAGKREMLEKFVGTHGPRDVANPNARLRHYDITEGYQILSKYYQRLSKCYQRLSKLIVVAGVTERAPIEPTILRR